MNFPDNQRTGRLAEVDADRLFTSWGWTTGKDHIDVGYDLFVEPDVEVFRGHRFLVQVKATSRAKRGPVAKVSKARLRDYARNPLPVLLVWCSDAGDLHWLHMQDWIKANRKRLDGRGDASVSLKGAPRLNDQAAMTAFLQDLFRPAEEQAGSLEELARRRGDFLSSIDPNVGVRVSMVNGAETYELYGKGESPAAIHVSLRANELEAEEFRQALKFGLGAKLSAEDLRIQGSDVVDHIVKESSGSLEIHRTPIASGTLTLHPGTTFDILARQYTIEAQFYSGEGGSAVTNDGAPDTFIVALKMDTSAVPMKCHITMGLNEDVITSKPVAHLEALARLGDWAADALAAKGCFFEVNFSGSRATLTYTDGPFEESTDLLRQFVRMGALHRVAKALGSDLTLFVDMTFSKWDVWGIHAAYALLKGESLRAEAEWVGDFSVHPEASEEAILMESALELSFCGRPLGVLPVVLEAPAIARNPAMPSVHGSDRSTPVLIRYNHQGPITNPIRIGVTP